MNARQKATPCHSTTSGRDWTGRLVCDATRYWKPCAEFSKRLEQLGANKAEANVEIGGSVGDGAARHDAPAAAFHRPPKLITPGMAQPLITSRVPSVSNPPLDVVQGIAVGWTFQLFKLCALPFPHSCDGFTCGYDILGGNVVVWGVECVDETQGWQSHGWPC